MLTRYLIAVVSLRFSVSPPPATEIDLIASKIADEAEYLSHHSHTAKAIVDFCKRNQIAVGGLDKGRLRKLWIDTLGLTVTGTFQSERENVDEDIAVAGTGPLKVEVDLMQPIDADKKPAVHNPPLNHIGLWIDDLAAAVAWLEKQGVRFTPGGIRKGAAGFDVTFIHPKENEQFPIGGAMRYRPYRPF